MGQSAAFVTKTYQCPPVPVHKRWRASPNPVPHHRKVETGADGITRAFLISD